MKTLSVNVYQYSELSEKAKEKARQWYLNCIDFDFDFEWKCLEDDAKSVGIELKEWRYGQYLNASLLYAAEDVCDKIMKEHGDSCETYKTASLYRKRFNDILPLYEAEDDTYDDKYEELKEEFIKDISEAYRIMVDRQYEYIQSEDAIEEAMSVNEWTFLENGKRF